MMPRKEFRSVNMERALHTKFKSYCAGMEESMSDVVTRLVNECMEDST